MDRDFLRKMLAAILRDIKKNDTNYPVRKKLILKAMWLAAELEWPVGVDIDLHVNPPGFPIVYFITIPFYGQISWHDAPHPNRYDGHSTPLKYTRIDSFIIDTERGLGSLPEIGEQ